MELFYWLMVELTCKKVLAIFNLKDDDQILGFLRGCKYSLERTKEKIDFHFTMRTLVPEFFHIRDPFAPEVQEILNAGVILPLPKPENQYGARVILWVFDNTNPDTMPYINLIVVFNMILDVIVIEDDDAMVNGVIICSDVRNISAKYVIQMTPALVKKHLKCMEEAYPLRIKRAYVANCPSYFEFVCNLVKSFAKFKLAQRLSVFSDMKNFYNEFPQSTLPKEYGGENGSVETIKVEWKNKIESYRDWFLENRRYQSEESLRCGEAKTSENVFGVKGSFRKLDVD
ncbi:hypothetical protein FQA39_LY11808 [Lamprigera yunnana]|nr:hypothetical protein FQA39_LY11808 [Lamprigera yunnana]